MQAEMALDGRLPPVDVPMRAVALCESEGDAIKASVDLRFPDKSDGWVAKRIGMSRTFFNEIKNGAKSMPADRVATFCQECGINLLRQFRDLQKQMRDAEHGPSTASRIAGIAREIVRNIR